MPEFIVAAVAWLGAEIGGTVGAYMMLEVTTAMVSTAMLVGGLAYSSMKARQMREDARDQYNASQVDRMVNITSAKAPRDLVLGRVRKGGTVFFKASTGTNNRDLYLAIALAGHEVDSIDTIYLNDKPVSLDGSGYVLDEPYCVTSTVSGSGVTPPVGATAVTEIRDGGAEGGTGTGVYNYQTTVTTSNVKITKHLGAAGQTVDADLHAAFPTDWPSTNVCTGIAYIVVKLTYNETSFPSGVPNITAIVRGAKLYDPRTGTTVWSENPALMMRHVYAHAKFGKASVTSAENARFTAAANTCDTSTVYTVASVAQPAMALFKAALVAPFGTPAKSLFDDLSQAMGGSWAFAGGELYLKPGIYTASVMSLTDADLAVVKRSGASEQQSPIGISVHKERAQKFNTVKPTIWDGDQDYKQVALTPLAGAALVTRDGVELVQEVSMPAVSYAPQALHICGILMRDARDPLVVDLPFKLRAYPLELFDTVDLTLSRYGWSAKTFMVLSRTWNMDGSIQLTLKETSASITQMDASFLAQGWAANTNLPTPWAVADVGTLTIASGTAELMRQADGTVVSRMRVTWTQVADAAVVQNGQIEVQYRKSDETGAWTSIVVPGNETQCITSEVEDGIIYIVRARAKTSVAVGDWCAQVEASIVGKTSAPSNVTGLANSNTDTSINLSWNACTDADYSDTELREGVSWAAGGLLFKGDACKWSAVGVPSATYTVWAKHFDTSGNESAAAAGLSVVFNLIRPIASIGDYASAPSTTGLLKNNVYKNTTNGNTYILSTDSGSWVLWIEKGTPGDDGVRGTVNLADAGHTSWPSDATVDAVISAAGYGAPQNRDMVTMYGAGYSETRFYLASGGTSPSAHWNTIAAYINGNMLVDGTVVADAINAGAIDGETITGATVRTADSGSRMQMDSTGVYIYNGTTIVGRFGPASIAAVVDVVTTGTLHGVYATGAGGLDCIYGWNSSSGTGVHGRSSTGSGLWGEASAGGKGATITNSNSGYTAIIGTSSYALDAGGPVRSANAIEITIATGTKPLAITSTTKCTNLNVEYWGDFKWGTAQGPGASGVGWPAPPTGVDSAGWLPIINTSGTTIGWMPLVWIA